ncbi:MAG: YeeE/YedE family protein [Phycisphaerales bacterium]|nr:MAG: YeeE/YedE family protein [Phycisphaerales bacterium]
MYDPFLASPLDLIYGAITGFIFGFLLQKGGVTRYQVILGQFLMKDFTVAKVMLTAIIVGAAGIYGMLAIGVDIALDIKNAQIIGNIVGGLIFGVGMVLLGYCPGTALAAMGDGSRHAIFGVAGGLVGAAIYAEAYPFMQARVLGVADYGRITIDSAAGFSPWWIIVVMIVIAAVGFYLLEMWERGGRAAATG